jgi:hypothetical protein
LIAAKNSAGMLPWAPLRFGNPFLVRPLHASLRSADGEIIDVL